MSVQKTLLSFVEVENSLLGPFLLSYTNNNRNDYSQHLSVYELDVVLSFLP